MSDGSTVLEPINVYSYDPTTNLGLAQKLNLPNSTLFYKPDMAEGYVDYKDYPDGEDNRAYFDERKKGDEYHPPPTAANPNPPEFIPDDASALAVCLSPDVCRSPEKPIPYQCWGKGDDKNNYSPDVRSNGLVIKRQDSQFHCSHGDEPGVGLGVKSGTVGDIVEPVTSSTIVRANGIPVQRHTDRCTLNSGNCPGEYVHVKSTETTPAPDATDEEDKAWYEKAWDWTGEKLSEAGQAIDEFDRNNGRVVTRTVGGLQAVGGAAEAVAGAALAGVGGAATGTGVGAAPGVPAMIGGGLLVANGYDNFQAGLRQAWTGESTPTIIASGSGDLARFAGASEQTAQQVENTVGMVQGVAGGTGAVAAGMRVAGRTAGAVETGVQGARSTQYVSDADLLVTNRNGVRISKKYRRPGFRKKTKEDAWNNAKDAEGKVFDPNPDNPVEIKPTDKWDMGHKPGYEFWKHQESAQSRDITREQFLNEYNNASHYRPELPSSNQSHKLEAPDDLYYGD